MRKFLGIAIGLSTMAWAGNTLDSCGYPQSMGNDSKNRPYTFMEDEFVRAIGLVPSGIAVWYNDDTPVTLGIAQGFTKVGSTTTADQGPVPVGSSPLQLGINGWPLSPVNADGFDDEGRPSWPTIFVSDVSSNATNTSGDLQNGGSPINPSAIYGTWVSARKLNQSNNSSFTPGVFPPMNNWSGLPDAPTGGFASYTNEGYGAEVVFPTGSLIPGHTYRVQAIFHDSDSKNQGGEPGTPGGGVGGGGSFGGNGLGNRGGILDAGEACHLVTLPIACSQGVSAWWYDGSFHTANNVCTCPAGSLMAGQPPAVDLLNYMPGYPYTCGGGE